ncbi:hypothetical protein H4582DRAFT_2000331 [Lactarius indigo]|nr:hypothetical protein H4582DRAFT_2000331 [Lactarius indigo]
MTLKRGLFPSLFYIFVIQISVNTQASMNDHLSGCAAPIARLRMCFLHPQLTQVEGFRWVRVRVQNLWPLTHVTGFAGYAGRWTGCCCNVSTTATAAFTPNAVLVDCIYLAHGTLSKLLG